MLMKNWLAILIVMSIGLAQPLWAQEQTMRMYGPGGALAPMKECAELFSQMHGIKIEITTGPESKWIGQAKQDADVFFGGTESLMSDFVLRHPDLIDVSTRTSLYTRGAGIVVRKGNPKRIESLADLTKDGIRIIDVVGQGLFGLWEDMAGAKGLIPGIQRNTIMTVENGSGAVAKWKSMPELDAWVTLEPWHHNAKDVSDFVRIPEADRIYRGASVAVTKISKTKEQARLFIEFLRSDQAHAIFQRWGWK